jgi:hypothetical protein
MLFLDTPSTAWDTAQVTFTLDPPYLDPPHTIVLTGYTNAYDAMTYIMSELRDNLSGAGAWSWAWTTYDTAGGVVLSLTYDDDSGGTFSTNVNAAFTTVLGFEDSSGDITHSGSDAPLGCWEPPLGLNVRSAGYRLARDGDCGGGRGVRPEAPALALGRPTVSAVCTPEQAYGLTTKLVAAATPRFAWLYHLQGGTGVWTRVAVGDVQQDREGAMHYRVNFTVLEEV